MIIDGFRALVLFPTFVDFRAMPDVARETVPFPAGLSLFVPAWIPAVMRRCASGRSAGEDEARAV